MKKGPADFGFSIDELWAFQQSAFFQDLLSQPKFQRHLDKSINQDFKIYQLNPLYYEVLAQNFGSQALAPVDSYYIGYVYLQPGDKQQMQYLINLETDLDASDAPIPILVLNRQNQPISCVNIIKMVPVQGIPGFVNEVEMTPELVEQLAFINRPETKEKIHMLVHLFYQFQINR